MLVIRAATSGDELKAMYHFISGYTAKAGVFQNEAELPRARPDPKKDSKTFPDGFGDMIFPSINHSIYTYIHIHIYIYILYIYIYIILYYIYICILRPFLGSSQPFFMCGLGTFFSW